MTSYLPLIFIPMIISNILHMVIVKKEACASWAVPISRDWFGANKTWRGVVVVTLLNGFFFWMVNVFLLLFGHVEAFVFGCILGLVYVLFELPNSWLKRRMGIGAGERSKKRGWLFMLLDKTDSALGVSWASMLLFDLTWGEGMKLFLLAVGIHVFFSYLLVVVGVKKRF